jgi:MFS family permease
MKNIKSINTDKLWTRPFILIICTHFLVYTSIYIMMSTLPLFMLHIGGNKFMAGFISAIFTFIGFFTRPWFGKLLDIKGRKLIMLIGIFLILIPVISYAALSSILLLLAFRVVHGIGWSAASTAASTIATDLIPSSRRFEGMGYFGMAASVAMAIGPALGLWLMGKGNYTLLFMVTALFVVSGLVLGFFTHSNTGKAAAPKKEEKPEKKGSILEKTALGPSLVFLLVSMTYAGIATFLPSYGVYRGVSNIGLFFSLYALTLFLTRPVTGKLADRIGTAKVILPGMICIMAALFLLVKASSLPVFLAAGVFYGIGFGSTQPILNALSVSLAPADRRGAAHATFLAAMDLGMGIGALGWGAVSQSFGYVYIYSISIILAALAGVAYLVTAKGNKIYKKDIPKIEVINEN